MASTIQFNGKQFATYTISINGERYLIGLDTMFDALMNEDKETAINDEAAEINESIFFYVPDIVAEKGLLEITNYVVENSAYILKHDTKTDNKIITDFEKQPIEAMTIEHKIKLDILCALIPNYPRSLSNDELKVLTRDANIIGNKFIAEFKNQ